MSFIISITVCGALGGETFAVWGRSTRRKSIRQVYRIDARRSCTAKERNTPRMKSAAKNRRAGERIALEKAATVLETPPFPGQESRTITEGSGSTLGIEYDLERMSDSVVSCHEPPYVIITN